MKVNNRNSCPLENTRKTPYLIVLYNLHQTEITYLQVNPSISSPSAVFFSQKTLKITIWFLVCGNFWRKKNSINFFWKIQSKMKQTLSSLLQLTLKEHITGSIFKKRSLAKKKLHFHLCPSEEDVYSFGKIQRTVKFSAGSEKKCFCFLNPYGLLISVKCFSDIFNMYRIT